MSKLTLLYIFLSICICTASVFILQHANQPVKIAEKTTIDSYVIGAIYTEYNSKGQIKTKMTAEKITHYQPQGTSVIEKPFIITYAADRTPWHIHADKAESDATGKKIILQGHVTIHEFPTKAHSETTIKTTELTLFPKKSLAETNKPVTLSQPFMSMDGNGFIANLKTGRYELKSESKVIYQPDQQPTPTRTKKESS